MALQLAQMTSVGQMKGWLGESESRFWRVIEHYVEKEVSFQDFSQKPIDTLCMDEVARSKGHRYVTNFLEFQRAKVVFVAPGRGKHTAQAF